VLVAEMRVGMPAPGFAMMEHRLSQTRYPGCYREKCQRRHFELDSAVKRWLAKPCCVEC